MPGLLNAAFEWLGIDLDSGLVNEDGKAVLAYAGEVEARATSGAWFDRGLAAMYI